MSLIVVFTNDETGTIYTGHYNVGVFVNEKQIWGGRLEWHPRQEGWKRLLKNFGDKIWEEQNEKR